MKRKQKVPRRTRRRTTQNPDVEELTIFKTDSVYENRCDTEKDSKKEIDDLKDNKEKRKSSPNHRSELENIESSKNTKTIDKSLIDKKPQAVESTGCNHSQTPSRELDESLKDCTKSNRNLKRPLEDDTLTKDVLRTPKAFINFGDESGDSNMPVILNVFTFAAPNIRQKKANRIVENNFPVTPPCSPPLLRYEHTNHTGISKNEMVSSLDHGFSKPKFTKSTVVPKLFGINDRIRHEQPNVVHPMSAATVGQKICQRDITIENEAARFQRNGDNIRLSEAKVENNFIPFSSRSVTTGNLIIQENQLSTIPTSGEITVGSGYPDQKIFSELLQERQRFGRSERSSRTSLEPKNIENGRLGPLSTCNNKLTFYVNLESPLVERPIQNVHKPRFNSPATSCDRDNVTEDHFYLSPRDIKVIELKKKLQEQEAVLKKLRKCH
ncbi:uncharacterized protein LOC114521359 [Dendronephthya gigantea]|uniref:uncharacterized protein LOC114521359 n=1 Tax=Dendronephthya gigantea TaxID=151771 RepID=UPI00106BB562|nr:uncharacterized protein LOC114521359 [Dendronephthya gigantea]XP_028397576.1 uncharacterized protein LOC114521359 [Dendronephthya gigantea]